MTGFLPRRELETTWPSVVAGGRGRIAVTFPGTPSADVADLSRPWNQYVVMSVNALDRDPTFVSAVANPGGPGDPIHRGKCQNRCGNIYDFIDIEIAPDAKGTVWVATTDTCTTFRTCSTVRAPGATGIILGQQDGVSADMQGVAIRQVSGPRLRGPQPRR